MPSSASRHDGHQLVSLPFLGWGKGSFLYSVRDEHTRVRPHKFSLRPKKTGGFEVVAF